MNRMMQWLCAAFAAFSLATQAAPVAGQDYTVLAHPQPVEVPGKVEVIEFFSFGCPHCDHYEPYVEAWAAKLPRDAVLRREHANFEGRTDWAPYAHIAFTLKAMGKLDIMAQRVFDAVHRQHVELRDESVLFPWIAQQGVDRAKFESIWKSFGIQAQLSRAEQLPGAYQISGVPEFVVNGKYLVEIGAGDEDGRKLFATINQLVDMERHARSK